MSTAPQTVTLHDGTVVELWDRAPVAAAPSGYCDPHWTRIGDRWHIVARPRANARRAAPGWHAWDVHDGVMAAHRVMADLPVGLHVFTCSEDHTSYIATHTRTGRVWEHQHSAGGALDVRARLTIDRDAYGGPRIAGQPLFAAS